MITIKPCSNDEHYVIFKDNGKIIFSNGIVYDVERMIMENIDIDDVCDCIRFYCYLKYGLSIPIKNEFINNFKKFMTRKRIKRISKRLKVKNGGNNS